MCIYLKNRIPKCIIGVLWSKYQSYLNMVISQNYNWSSMVAHTDCNALCLLVIMSTVKQVNWLDPDEGVVKLGVNGLQVFQSPGLVQDALVERQREARVDEFPMKQGLQESEDNNMFSNTIEIFPNPVKIVIISPLGIQFDNEQIWQNKITMAMKRPMNLKYLRWSGLM